MIDKYERQKRYAKTKKGKIARDRAFLKYIHSDKGKLGHKLRNDKYNKTKKGMIAIKKKNDKHCAFHSPINNLRQRNKLILENCAICNSSENIECHHPNPEMPLHIYFLCRIHHFEQHYTPYFNKKEK